MAVAKSVVVKLLVRFASSSILKFQILQVPWSNVQIPVNSPRSLYSVPC